MDNSMYWVFGLAVVVVCVTDPLPSIPKYSGRRRRGEERVWIGIMVSEFLVPHGTHYVMNLAWCGCTIFDQTVPEGIHFGCGFLFPIKLTTVRPP